MGSEGTNGMSEGVEHHRLEELLWVLMNLLCSPRKTSVPGRDSQLLVGRKILMPCRRLFYYPCSASGEKGKFALQWTRDARSPFQSLADNRNIVINFKTC